MTGGADISIIVPTLDEAATITATVQRLAADFPDAEILVVDGGSTDGTPGLVRPPARLVTSLPGRGRQLNAGAEAARGNVLWFIHADTTLQPAALGQLRDALADERVAGGGFTLAFDRRSPGLDYLRWTSNLRARHLGWLFGDQALFVRREVFDTVGGFPDSPLMEDLELSRRLRRLRPRRRVVLLPATCTASARRLQASGVWSMVIFMQYLKALHLAGVDPAALSHRYAAGPPWRRRSLHAHRQKEFLRDSLR